MTKRSIYHSQLLVAPTRKFILDRVRTHLVAAGIIKIILLVVVASTVKFGGYSFKQVRNSPKPGFDFDQKMWPRVIIRDLCKLRFPQFHIGWGA